MRTQTPTKRVYLLDPNEVDNLALDGTVTAGSLRARKNNNNNKIKYSYPNSVRGGTHVPNKSGRTPDGITGT